MENRIICANCGHLEVRDDIAYDHVYFPNRMVYLKGSSRPHSCEKCGSWQDMVIFGRNRVSFIMNVNMGELSKLPHVIESNKVYEENKKK